MFFIDFLIINCSRIYSFKPVFSIKVYTNLFYIIPFVFSYMLVIRNKNTSSDLFRPLIICSRRCSYRLRARFRYRPSARSAVIRMQAPCASETCEAEPQRCPCICGIRKKNSSVRPDTISA